MRSVLFLLAAHFLFAAFLPGIWATEDVPTDTEQADQDSTTETSETSSAIKEQLSLPEPAKEPFLLAGIHLGSYYVISGYQLDFARQGFETDNVLMNGISLGAAAELRPAKWLGFQAGYTFGRTSATARNGAATTNISLFSWQDLQLGANLILFREIVGETNQNTLEIYAGGGMVFTSLDFTGDFKDMLTDAAAAEGYLLIFPNKSATGTGYYFRTGANILTSSKLYLQGELELKHQEARFPNSAKDLNGTHLGIRLGAGIFF